jgi:hypothetical protein
LLLEYLLPLAFNSLHNYSLIFAMWSSMTKQIEDDSCFFEHLLSSGLPILVMNMSHIHCKILQKTTDISRKDRKISSLKRLDSNKIHQSCEVLNSLTKLAPKDAYLFLKPISIPLSLRWKNMTLENHEMWCFIFSIRNTCILC